MVAICVEKLDYEKDVESTVNSVTEAAQSRLGYLLRIVSRCFTLSAETL